MTAFLHEQSKIFFFFLGLTNPDVNRKGMHQLYNDHQTSAQISTRARIDGAPSQIPTLKFFTPPAPTSPYPGYDPGNRMKILFNMFSIFYLKEFGIKLFQIDMLMIFDLLTSPRGHQFETRMKMLLAFCSAHHPRRFDMPHDHV